MFKIKITTKTDEDEDQKQDKPLYHNQAIDDKNLSIYEDHFRYAVQRFDYTPVAAQQFIDGLKEKVAKQHADDLALITCLCLSDFETREEIFNKIKSIAKWERVFNVIAGFASFLPALLPFIDELDFEFEGGFLISAFLIPFALTYFPSMTRKWGNITKRSLFNEYIAKRRRLVGDEARELSDPSDQFLKD